MAAVKRRRLQELIGVGGVSDSALAKILANLRAKPIQEKVSRQDCSRAVQDGCRDLLVSVQVPLASGGEVTWKFLSPQRLVQKCLGRSAGVAAIYREALRRHPNSSDRPWGMALYFDELTPGNVLRPDNKRKTMAVYMSFVQLGHEALARTEMWFTIAVARTTLIRQTAGGWSHLLRLLLRYAFIGPDSFENGLVVDVGGASHLLFARLSNIIADESALKDALCCKGAAGIRPCPCCNNVIKKDTDIVNRDTTGYLVELTCSDAGKFDLASDRDLFDITDLLQRSKGTMGVGAFKDLEKSCGFNHNEHGLLADVELRAHLRPASVLTFDPMHCLWSNGATTFEVHLFMKRMVAKTKFGWQDLEGFCRADWQFPSFCRSKGKAIYEVFNTTREKASKESFKTGATDLLLVFPLLLYFAEMFVASQLPSEMQSLRAMSDLIHESHEAKFGRGDPRRISVAASRHLELFRRTYGDEQVHPKHHYVFHLPKQLDRDGWLMDAFSLERKHQEVKRSASHTDNTSDFEASVLGRQHLDELREQASIDIAVSLAVKSARCEPLGAQVADGLFCRGLRLYSGDVVFKQRSALLVCGAALFDSGDIELLVRPLVLGKRLYPSVSMWKSPGCLARCEPIGFRLASCWSITGDEYTVLE